jgi:dTMP kinase
MTRGILIVFEGCDRSGKTTQCQKLVQRFHQQGLPVESIRFPNRSTAIGNILDKYLENKADLSDHALHLLFSANRWELMTNMANKLLEGINLIVDRYAYSGVAFSATKPLMDIEWCKQADVGIIKPDVVIFLDSDPSSLQNREGFGAERYENVPTQTLAKANYRQLQDETWKIVNANQSLTEVHEEICKIVETSIKELEISYPPLKRLWVTAERSPTGAPPL